MVCQRCVSSVEAIFTGLGLDVHHIQLGEVELTTQPTKANLQTLSYQLSTHGFELLKDADQQLIAKIKSVVLNFVNTLEPKEKLSQHLAAALHKDYNGLSKLFSEVEGRTIENYFIAIRVERAKEYISYAELSLSEIAYKLNFSNVAHLSAQFKKVTGMTPTAFKKLGNEGRKGLEKV